MGARQGPFDDPWLAAGCLHDRCWGGPGWYAGVAAEPSRRLETEHRVDLVRGEYSWLECVDADVARYAAWILHERFYYRGGGDDDDRCRFVYAYRITLDTRQPGPAAGVPPQGDESA
ncbi:MAG: hypothetical protein HY906_04085 [Deltaproteobacteria bacterium]|nr:hypothetical protein [Deltaproteobacteria bacterium]